LHLWSFFFEWCNICTSVVLVDVHAQIPNDGMLAFRQVVYEMLDPSADQSFVFKLQDPMLDIADAASGQSGDGFVVGPRSTAFRVGMIRKNRHDPEIGVRNLFRRYIVKYPQQCFQTHVIHSYRIG